MEDDDDESSAGLKRRRTDNSGGHIRIVGLVPFWRAVDEWLSELTKKWGSHTDHVDWQRYIVFFIFSDYLL